MADVAKNRTEFGAIGFDTLEFIARIDSDTAKYKSETPPMYYDRGAFAVQFMNYRARYECGYLQFYGSIQKAIDGQNVYCDISAQYEYICRLFDYLELARNSAKIRRFDIAATTETETQPISFIRGLGDLSGRVKRIVGDKLQSVYFDKYAVKYSDRKGKTETKENSLLFYDKGYQSGTHGNLLRCEWQNYKPKPTNTIQSIFHCFDNYTAEITKELEKITFKNDITMKATTKAELKNAMTIYAIRAAERENPNFVTETIDLLKQTSGAERKEFWRFKNDIVKELNATSGGENQAIIERLKAAFLNV